MPWHYISLDLLSYWKLLFWNCTNHLTFEFNGCYKKQILYIHNRVPFRWWFSILHHSKNTFFDSGNIFLNSKVITDFCIEKQNWKFISGIFIHAYWSITCPIAISLRLNCWINSRWKTISTPLHTDYNPWQAVHCLMIPAGYWMLPAN